MINGNFVFSGDGSASFPYAHVDNLVDAVLTAANTPRAAGEAYNVVDGQTTGLAYTDRFRHWLRLEPFPTRPEITPWCGRYSGAKAERELGYVPGVSYEEAMSEPSPHHSGSDPDYSLPSQPASAMGFWPSIGSRRLATLKCAFESGAVARLRSYKVENIRDEGESRGREYSNHTGIRQRQSPYRNHRTPRLHLGRSRSTLTLAAAEYDADGRLHRRSPERDAAGTSG